MAAAGPPLHANLAPLSGFLGTWRGEGEGFYPTIAAFRYGEELTFAHAGKARLRSAVHVTPACARASASVADACVSEHTTRTRRASQPVMQTGHKTWRLLADGANGGPLHAESGFWRCAAPGGGVDAAQASGIAEHTRGTYDAAARRIELRSAGVLNATKARSRCCRRCETATSLSAGATAGAGAVRSRAAAPQVAEVVRAYTLSADGATLTYEISMATTTQPLQAHLRATLTKVG